MRGTMPGSRAEVMKRSTNTYSRSTGINGPAENKTTIEKEEDIGFYFSFIHNRMSKSTTNGYPIGRTHHHRLSYTLLVIKKLNSVYVICTWVHMSGSGMYIGVGSIETLIKSLIKIRRKKKHIYFKIVTYEME